MAGELIYSYGDLYPNLFNTNETSHLATPDNDDLDALNEDTKVAEEVKTTGARTKNVLLALGVLVAIIVFFGGGND